MIRKRTYNIIAPDITIPPLDALPARIHPTLKAEIISISYALNDPLNYVDPNGLLAELYCDKIGSSRGGAKNSVYLLIAHPTHCYLRVACHGKDVFVELWGPPQLPDGTFAKHGIPHNDSPYNAGRAGDSEKRPLTPPAGMKCCEFEDRLMNAFGAAASNLPQYSGFPGPNSNTFVHDIITTAGGTADFPWNAYGWDFNVVKPPLDLKRPIVTQRH